MTARVASVRQSSIAGHRSRAMLQCVFESIDAQSCPYRYNFHLHSVYSDGCLTPESIVAQATQYGLEGLALTDHHSIDGYFAVRRALDRATGGDRAQPFLLWTGVEVTVDLADTRVHVLGYGFDPDSPALTPYLQGTEPDGDDRDAGRAIAAIQAAGGLAVLAHPMRYRESVDVLIPQAAELGIDGVEAFYTYKNPEPWITSPKQTAHVLDLARQFNLLTTCGTDSHGPSILRKM